jgi:hypothetical protein
MASKKCKIVSECRVFKDEWSWKYFFTILKDKSLCLHFISKYNNANYAAMTEAERKQKTEELRNKISGMQNKKKHSSSQKAATHASYIFVYL